MALGTSFTVENYNAGPNNALTCGTSTDGRGCLFLTGGLIQNNRGAVGLVSGEGYVKRYSYDRCAVINPPPYFPTTGRFLDNRYYELDPVRVKSATMRSVVQEPHARRPVAPLWQRGRKEEGERGRNDEDQVRPLRAAVPDPRRGAAPSGKRGSAPRTTLALAHHDRRRVVARRLAVDAAAGCGSPGRRTPRRSRGACPRLRRPPAAAASRRTARRGSRCRCRRDHAHAAIRRARRELHDVASRNCASSIATTCVSGRTRRAICSGVSTGTASTVRPSWLDTLVDAGVAARRGAT